MKGNRIPLLLAAVLLTGLSVPAEHMDCALIERENRATATTPAQVTGVKRVLWHCLAYADDSRQPASTESAQAAMETANSILNRISFGKVSLTWSITPMLQLPRTAAFYSTNLPALLNDAKALATQAGFDHANFDRDLIAPPAMSGWMQGMAAIGGNWLYVGVPHGGLIVHELGHTFGLPHANGWSATRPDPFTKKAPPFPSNIAQLGGGYSFQTNSFVGRVGIMFPGNATEYGDAFDIMAGSATNSDFSVIFKTRLGWISRDAITRVSSSGVYRIYKPSTTVAGAPHPFAIAIDKPIVGRTPGLSPRNYWIEVAPSSENKVLLRWVDLTESQATLLIDAFPGTPAGFNDAGLPIGRSFDDPGLGLSITPVAAGNDNAAAWIDVAIDFGASAKAAMNPQVAPPDFAAYQITGRVTDTAGKPLANCRIHNGRINRVVNDRGDFASTETDASGNYTLWVSDPWQPYTVGASIYGYKASPAGDEQVVSVPESGTAANVNFIFEPLPRISISAPEQLIEGQTNVFTISRTGATNEAVEVWWQTTGAADDFDYVGPFGSGIITIPAGSSSTNMQIAALPTAGISAQKNVTLHATIPSSFPRDGVNYSYPGWELRDQGSQPKWFQTNPPYAVFAEAAATIRLLDALDPAACRVAIASVAPGATTLEVFAPVGKIVHVQQSTNLIEWKTIDSQVIRSSPSTIPLPLGSEKAVFTRAEIVDP